MSELLCNAKLRINLTSRHFLIPMHPYVILIGASELQVFQQEIKISHLGEVHREGAVVGPHTYPKLYAAQSIVSGQ